jgi:aromatic-L-amino-acid decarboxylase
MNPEEFRQAGHELIDWIADYRTNLDDGPVLATAGPGEVSGAMAKVPPTEVRDMSNMLSELERVVLPGLTQVQHPMHYGWFPSNASLSSVLGDIASSGIGALGISWESCPALTEVEEVVCEWMRQLTGLSDQWSGTIQDTASTACLVGGGLQAVDRPPVVYTTEQAHSSVRKAALLAGFGADNLRTVNVDPTNYAMDPAHLAEVMAADVAAGRLPVAVVVSIGTTGTTAMDPISDLIPVAKAHDAWVHIDSAMAGSALLLPEYRHLWDGMDDADSICWNPHKWMGTILDTSLYYIKDVAQLVRVMSTNPSYLWSDNDGEVTQYRDWGLPLGRRFRALKLWFQLELDGVASIQTRLRRDLDNAAWLAEQITGAADWELVAPVPLQTVCVRHRPDGLSGEALDLHTLDWVGRINQSGAAYLTPSKLDDRWMVRVSVGVESTERHHLEQLWSLMQQAADAALSARSGETDQT